MNISDVIEILDLEIIVEGEFHSEVKGGYTSDLLSNVMAKAKKGDLWFTIQGHQNIVAIADLLELAGVVIAEGLSVDDNTIAKAEELAINIFRSNLTSYQLSGMLYRLGIE